MSIEIEHSDDGKIFTDEDRIKRTKKEFNKLRRIIKNIDKDKKTLCEPLIKNIAFCIVQLDELRLLIERDGYYQTYKNGENQYGTKKSIASDLIIQLGKTYTMYLGKLKDFLPAGTVENDALVDFERKHKLTK